MNYALPADLWDKVIPLSALIGAVAGLIWDVGNAIRRSGSEPATGFDNVITLPRGWKADDGSRNLELGFLGPMLVGAMAGTLLVLLAGRSSAGGQDAATAISQVSQTVTEAPTLDQAQGYADEAQQIVEDNLGTQITAYSLFLFAALGGLAGWPLLRAMTTRTSKLIEAAVGVAFEPASRSANEAVQAAVESLDLPASQQLTEVQKQQLGEAAEQAVQDSAPTALRVK
jgi:hypothetical protein